MHTINTGKFKINLDAVCAGVVNDSGVFMIYFVDGSSITLSPDNFEEVFKNNPDFIEFTEKVIINKKHILYVKNNFENKKPNKYKITIVVPKHEYYKAFMSTPEGYAQAKDLFTSLL